MSHNRNFDSLVKTTVFYAIITLNQDILSISIIIDPIDLNYVKVNLKYWILKLKDEYTNYTSWLLKVVFEIHVARFTKRHTVWKRLHRLCTYKFSCMYNKWKEVNKTHEEEILSIKIG